jgi:glutathione S-transferase
MYRLYDYLPSGNGYKVRLVLRQLALPYELIELDILKRETRSSGFLARNPNGRIPLLEVGPGRYLAESHAIIGYLAEGSALVPNDRYERALMWQWLCFEQYSLEPNIATVRFWLHSQKKSEAECGPKLAEKREAGYAALGVLEQGVTGRRFLVGERLSLADIGLYAYTHVADEGGFDLARYPAVRAWHAGLAGLPLWAPITAR